MGSSICIINHLRTLALAATITVLAGFATEARAGSDSLLTAAVGASVGLTRSQIEKGEAVTEGVATELSLRVRFFRVLGAEASLIGA